ncbi:MAG: bifunctional diaminohydroxyphosphoribosylaminopyrimidine deaminase/5-amino-6-(5-phosphoribosylamino)uracil reductase RibD [Thermoguttaceae bacterium]|nr:bifunctional diaminohydroxyphosphoribosylaminopyrimidine deaminase/5-amino-6-(5-phosphoribosylamino)uracil reductase RibD [Thermoguttaceae bacterium]
MDQSELDRWHMQRALELAARGRGWVEPNPMVGCVIARGAEVIAEGWHRRFGGPHAEVEAIRMAGPRAKGATLYVTLEPCCHFGKTPPCTCAILEAGISRVVASVVDPFPAVAGKGLEELRAAGVEVLCGVLEHEARSLLAPYLKLVGAGRPWVILKWAMTLDGKIATRTGKSRWISSPRSREVVHRLRGLVDAIIVGIGTVLADDPLLLPQVPGPRRPARVILDSRARLPAESQLVRTCQQAPVIVAVGPQASPDRTAMLQAAGCEVLRFPQEDYQTRLLALLDELGRRKMTYVLVEGGAQVFASFFECGEVDEIHAFIAPKVFGGQSALGPVSGLGVAVPDEAWHLENPATEVLDGDIYVHGRVKTAIRQKG